MIEIRDLALEEADLAADFFHNYWRPNHVFYRDRRLLLWQYHNNPYASLFSEGLTFKAAFNDDALVGVFGYMPFVFNRYGSRKYGCYLSAWWVHPDHRRGPMGIRLLNELQFRMSFDACLAGINTPVAERLYERLGWVVVHKIPRLILPLDCQKLLSLLDQNDPETLTKVRQRLKSSGPPAASTAEKGTRVVELQSFDRLRELDWDSFYWKRFAPSYMGPARETVYLVWRYQEIPIFRYRALVAIRDGTISGLLVFRVEQIKGREEKVVRLVDFIADQTAIAPLINTLVGQARQQDAAMIDFFCTSPVYYSVLRACGFIDASDSTTTCYWFPHLFQPIDYTRMHLNCSWWINTMDLLSATARSDFFLTKGDYEFDLPN